MMKRESVIDCSRIGMILGEISYRLFFCDELIETFCYGILVNNNYLIYND